MSPPAVPGLDPSALAAARPIDADAWASADYALGAGYSPAATTFALFAANATRVVLELYAAHVGQPPVHEVPLARGSDGIWHAKLAGVPLGALYGFRCWGPNWPWVPEWRRGGSLAGLIADVDARGHRYNPNKLLFDPYARELSHDPVFPDLLAAGHDAGMYTSGPAPYPCPDGTPGARHAFDTGPWAPKGVVVHDTTSYGAKPHIPQQDAIIYEAHVRGLTRHPSAARLGELLHDRLGIAGVLDVPDAYRGTYKGAAYVAPYLAALGINAIELLPVHEFANGSCPDPDPAADAPPGNYWGYMTLGYFAPDRRYAFDKSYGGPTREFKEMVRAFHEAGIEVYLDVVYNHTGEGGLWPARDGSRRLDVETADLLFLRGIDNVSYYALVKEDPRFYWESTGCGNNLDCSQPIVSKLVVDSLVYWCREMGVDGFRFDLATVLGREAQIDHRFTGGAVLLEAISLLAEHEDIEVIAEAWDCEYPAGYQVGNFPRGWAEWNGGYRDTVRRFLKGDGGLARAFATVVNGDHDRFADQGGPHKSVAFITAHDGFTLMDLVSYPGKNNSVPWPFGPSDGGADDNASWDSGGDHALRRERLRSFFTVLLFSRGVPMIVGGDELGRTQNGNNNPWALDSAGVWHNWEQLVTNAPHRVPTGDGGAYHDNYGVDAGPAGRNALFTFVRHLTGLRRGHPCLRPTRFGDYAVDAGSDVTFTFKRPDFAADLDGSERALGWSIDGSAIGDDDFVLLINMEPCLVDFVVPAPSPGRAWRRVVDTARWAEPVANAWGLADAEPVAPGTRYGVHPYTVVVLQGVRAEG